eukprot:comp12833_c0_seq1/m.7996 comp12833_c0_seq1/g.7996  ORF comp12833_c0_seq1/g.7996 comp12833_c0_seq1/m.7996 type:complete len:101 (-) comp12833_c0_seq1:640-942(-)
MHLSILFTTIVLYSSQALGASLSSRTENMPSGGRNALHRAKRSADIAVGFMRGHDQGVRSFEEAKKLYIQVHGRLAFDLEDLEDHASPAMFDANGQEYGD